MRYKYQRGWRKIATSGDGGFESRPSANFSHEKSLLKLSTNLLFTCIALLFMCQMLNCKISCVQMSLDVLVFKVVVPMALKNTYLKFMQVVRSAVIHCSSYIRLPENSVYWPRPVKLFGNSELAPYWNETYAEANFFAHNSLNNLPVLSSPFRLIWVQCLSQLQ